MPRRRSLRSLVALTLLATSCVVLQACSSAPAPPPDLASRLQADTGAAWTIYTDPSSHEVRLLAPVTPVRIGSGTNEQDARAFFDRYRDQLHGTGKPDELRLVEAIDADDGTTHLRFEHVLPGTGLPVFDVTSTAHFTADGSAYWLRPGFRADLDGVSPVAKLSPDDALRAAIVQLRASCGAGAEPPSLGKSELGVRADDGQPAALAYRLQLSFPSARCVAPEVLVDANSGAILDQHELAAMAWDEKQPGVRNFILHDASDLKTIDYDNGIVDDTLESHAVPRIKTREQSSSGGDPVDVTKTHGVWDENAKYRGVGVSAHFWGYHAARFFAATGLCGCRPDQPSTASACNEKTRLACQDQTIVIHDTVNTKGTSTFNVGGVVYVGDDNALGGGADMPGAAAFDVIAHEMAHSITMRTSKLRTDFQAGALNESFSDVVGASAEEWFDETNDVQHPQMKNLVFGELWTKDGSGKRDMVDPGSRSHPESPVRPDADPDHFMNMLELRAGEDAASFDGGFVHRNAGIANRAFSLMTIGGTNKTSKISVTKGIGWKSAREIWFKTIPSLSPQSKIVEAAIAQLAEAGLRGPDVYQAVGCAWLAVGVSGLGSVIDPTVALLTCPSAPATPATPAPPPASVTKASSSCAGHADGVVCDPAAPTSASICKNGGRVDTALCADLATHCKPVSATDPTGSLTSDGQLICE